MNKLAGRAWLMTMGLLATLPVQAAVDSYRFAHVTIATPWYIFIFLLMGIFFPFVLMAVLAWKNAIRKSDEEEASEAERKLL